MTKADTLSLSADAARLKSARSAIGRAYRSVGNAMSQMSPTADQNALRYAIAQLDAAATSLRPLVLSQTPVALSDPYGEPGWQNEPVDWYFVDYSMPKSHACPTGRDSIRLKALSEADAIARAAIFLDGQGLGLRARINHSRRDTL